MAFQKGHKVSEETKRKLRKAGQKRNHSEQTKRKISQSLKGGKHSESTKQKISQSMIGNKNTFGHTLAKEHKEKISHARKNIFVGAKAPGWKDGRFERGGRILIMIPEHPHAQIGGYVLRSRLVMEKMLGRYLKPCEVVHHINAIVGDDRPENLQLFPNKSAHTKFHRNL